MVIKGEMKELKKGEISREKLLNIQTKLEQANLPKKEISKMLPKLKKLIKAGISDSNLKRVTQDLILKTSFRHRFLHLNLRKIPRLLAENDINLKITLPQISRQAESSEVFGFQFPHMAIDPSGKWVVQVGSSSPRGEYRLELFEIKNDKIF